MKAFIKMVSGSTEESVLNQGNIMRFGKGENRVILNNETMLNLLNEVYYGSTDQIITSVEQNSVKAGFVLIFNDKPNNVIKEDVK